MTSVVQLPVEAASAKAPPKGETRARANKPSEKIAEGEFAALLAQAFPQLAQAEKAGTPESLEVEGEGIPAEALDVADAGEMQLPGGAAKAAALAFVFEASLQEFAAEAVIEEGPKMAAADVAAFAETQVVELDDALRQQALGQSSRSSTQAPELTGSETKTLQEERAVDGPNAGAPKPVETFATTATDPPLATPAASTHAEQAPPTEAAVAEKQAQPPTMRRAGAAESKRLVETLSADEVSALTFRARRESPSQDARHALERSGWMRAAESQSKAAPQQATAERMVADVIESAAKEIRTAASRDAVRPAIDTRRHGDHGQEDGQAERYHSNDALNAPPKSVKSSPIRLASELEAAKDMLKQVAPKPAATALATNAPQMTAQANVQAEAPAVQLRDKMRPTTSASPPRAPEVAAQLQQQNGRTTLNVVLQDEQLGRVALQLVERGGWIETAIRASDPRTAQALSSGAAGLFDALQQRGLGLTTSGGGASAWDAQEGQRRDNPQRDQESLGRRFRLRRNGGEFEGALARAEV